MGKFSETRSSGRSTSAHNRPLSVIPRNSVTIDMSPLGKYHPGTNEGEVLAGQGSARLTRIGVQYIYVVIYSIADCCTYVLCVSYCLVLLYIVSFQPLLGCI